MHYTETEAYKNRKREDELPADHNSTAIREYKPQTWGNPNLYPTLDTIGQYLSELGTSEAQRLGRRVSQQVHSFNRGLKAFLAPWTRATISQVHGDELEIMHVNILEVENEMFTAKDYRVTLVLVANAIQSHNLGHAHHVAHDYKNSRIEALRMADLPEDLISNLIGYFRAKTTITFKQLSIRCSAINITSDRIIAEVAEAERKKEAKQTLNNETQARDERTLELVT